MRYQETKYGFSWGEAEIERGFSDERKGWVTLGIKTPKQTLQVYITKTGKIRIHDSTGKELK